jgi:fused signal recognition particle receptor
MFKKLREKLKSWTKKIPVEEIEEKNKTKEKTKKEKKKEKVIEKEIVKKEIIEKPKKEKKKKVNLKKFDEQLEELEMILLENNVAYEASENIIKNMKEKIENLEGNKKNIEKEIMDIFKEEIEKLLLPPFDLLKEIKDKKEPYIILFCGINGTGKTTTIAKLGNYFKKNSLKCVFGAGDTFRAAAVEQLKKHAENLSIPIIAHNYGSDPAAVGFDAIQYAKKNKIDVVLIDTAGRMHTAKNLLHEMEKIKRVCKPDRTIFVGESITGNDSIDQVKAFNETIGIDGIVLSKADVDEKGGTAISLGYTTQKPILYLGTGQNYKDLEKFDKTKLIEKLGFD